MLGIIPYKILTDKSLSDGDRVTFAIITACADENNQLDDDETKLADLRGVDPRTIRSQIAKLVQKGIIFRSTQDNKRILTVANERYFDSGNDVVVTTTTQLIKYWNSVMGADIPYTTVLERLVRRRLRDKSPEQLVRAIQGRISFIKTNPWFNKEENRAFKLRIDPILQSDEEVEKYLAYPIEDVSLIQIPMDETVKAFTANEGNQTVLE